MSRRITYHILNTGLAFGIGLSLIAGVASAQRNPTTPTETDVYCAGVATDQPVPADTYVISGEDANSTIAFSQFSNVYLNRGAEQGVKVGDQFEVMRAVHDPHGVKWFDWQPALTSAMGTMYADIGRIRVLNVLAKTSIAEIDFACEGMQRGDIARPFTPRVAPQYHAGPFDPFAAPSGKKTAMVVTTKNFGQAAGAGTTVYVNLGNAQGVHVGDYFRVFRYQGGHRETDYQNPGMEHKTEGFGSTPVTYNSTDVPRQVLGEGIVVRTGTNSSSVYLTLSKEEIFVGDYVEVE